MIKTSVAFANSFERAFHTATANLGVGEVVLFQALKATLIAQSSRFVVDVYHGLHHQVTFRHSNCASRLAARCELADLMLLTYDANSPEVRLCLLQAKSERDTALTSAYTYAANLEQWCLLAHRPSIQGVGNFAPSKALLSGASMESVGAFGFFHRDIYGNCELHFRAASRLHPTRPYSQRYGRLTTQSAPSLGGYRRKMECLAADSVKEFAESLYEVRIGTPVHISNLATQQWLGRMLMTLGRSQTRHNSGITEVLRRLDVARVSRASTYPGTPVIAIVRGEGSDGAIGLEPNRVARD